MVTHCGSGAGRRRLAMAMMLSIAGTGAVAHAAEPTLMRVRIATDEPAALEALLEARGFDVLEGGMGPASVDVVVNEREDARLRALGFVPELVEVGRPLREILAERAAGDGSVPAGYADLTGILGEMASVASSHPNIVTLVDLTTTYGTPPTFEGRHLFAVKVSDNPGVDEDEPSMLIVAAHHCREIVTPVIALNALHELTLTYGIDPGVTATVNSNEIWIAPVWNPDGYEFVFNVDNLWRKNRRVFPTGTGVDINRNYPFGWTNPCSGSTDPASLTYKGPSAASEAETQTMMAWTLDQRFDKVIDYHSSGQEVLWGYACPSHPFDLWLQGEAVVLSTISGYGGEERPPSADGEHYEWQFGARGAHAFLIETATSFQPSFATAQAEAALLYPGIEYMIDRPISLRGHVTDAVSSAAVEAAVDNVSITFPNGETNGSGGPFGAYHAFYPPGTYDVEFSAPGYLPQTHSVTVDDESSVALEVPLVPIVEGDLDGDGDVDFGDVLSLIGAWGPCPPLPDPCPADFDGSGDVGFADLLTQLANWTT